VVYSVGLVGEEIIVIRPLESVLLTGQTAKIKNNGGAKKTPK
jgi:hypothetical protein